MLALRARESDYTPVVPSPISTRGMPHGGDVPRDDAFIARRSSREMIELAQRLTQVAMHGSIVVDTARCGSRGGRHVAGGRGVARSALRDTIPRCSTKRPVMFKSCGGGGLGPGGGALALRGRRLLKRHRVGAQRLMNSGCFQDGRSLASAGARSPRGVDGSGTVACTS